MYLIGWWLTGVFLGWFIWKFYRVLRLERRSSSFEGESSRSSGTTMSGYEAAARLLLLVIASVLTKDSGQTQSAEPEVTRPDTGSSRPNEISGQRPGRALAIALATGLVIAIFAAANDHAALTQPLLFLQSFFVGLRVQALLVGIISGLVFRQYRVPLVSLAGRVGDAVIGDKDKTAWALQSALAIGLIAIGVFAIRPDILSYLRSVKLGTVEATFADQGPLPLRDARLNLRDFREKVAVEQYKKFREDFISKTSARGLARRVLGGHAQSSTLQTETGEIAALLFEYYVNPVLGSVLCLAKVHSLRTAIHDPDLSAYASTWEDFLLNVHAGIPELTANELNSFLTALRGRYEPFVERVSRLNPSCMKPVVAATPRRLADKEVADLIYAHYTKAREILRESGDDKPAIRALVVFEPYLTGAASDLISLISGEREKTDFLLNMLEDFPLSDDLVTPGIINLYYQVTDSWLNSIGSVPLDLVRAQIEYATRGAEIMMARSEKRLNELEKTASAKGQAIEPENDPDKMKEIFDIFLRNSFATLTAEVDIYVQRVLSGETVPEGHRQSWMKASSRLQAMLQTRSSMPAVDLVGLPRIELSSFEKLRMRVAKIDPDFMLQADLAIALTAVLLNDPNRPSAQICNAALFYVNDANMWVQPTIKENELDKAQERRLRQLIAVVANRVGDACNWTDRRG
ncbi:hypothetical protein [Bradyrhizobium barranii]